MHNNFLYHPFGTKKGRKCFLPFFVSVSEQETTMRSEIGEQETLARNLWGRGVLSFSLQRHTEGCIGVAVAQDKDLPVAQYFADSGCGFIGL